ncbi:MAG: hypothetical protein R3A44_39220 [Caldilineaceae bacterium]
MASIRMLSSSVEVVVLPSVPVRCFDHGHGAAGEVVQAALQIASAATLRNLSIYGTHSAASRRLLVQFGDLC